MGHTAFKISSVITERHATSSNGIGGSDHALGETQTDVPEGHNS